MPNTNKRNNIEKKLEAISGVAQKDPKKKQNKVGTLVVLKIIKKH